jgi:hypothetical protein
MKKILQLIIAVSLLLVVVDRPGINACELKIVELARYRNDCSGSNRKQQRFT